MENGFLFVCPCGVVGMSSHMEFLHPVQGGPLLAELLPVNPCTVLSISNETSQNVTYSQWHPYADLQTSQLFPSKFLCHAKTRGMSALCSCPLCRPFPLTQTQRTGSFQPPKTLKTTLIYKSERPEGYSSDKRIRRDIIGTEAYSFKLLIHIFGHRVGTF